MTTKSADLVRRVHQKIALWKRTPREGQRTPTRLIVGRKTYREIVAATKKPDAMVRDQLRDTVYAECGASTWIGLEIVKCNRERYLRVL